MRMQRGQARRLGMVAALALGGSVVFQANPGCRTFTAETVLSAIDFCAIINCQGGLFGGVIQPCGSPNTALDDFLADCRNFDTAN